MTDDETINIDQVRVERLVSDLRNNIAELAVLRLDDRTAHYVAAEEVSLGGALTALQMLMSHIAIAADQPKLMLVR